MQNGMCSACRPCDLIMAPSVITLVALLLLQAQAVVTLHCLLHDHCGDNAVCVTSRTSSNPKCMCLLGYRGNGATCLPDNAWSEFTNTVISLGKRVAKAVVIQKNCTRPMSEEDQDVDLDENLNNSLRATDYKSSAEATEPNQQNSAKVDNEKLVIPMLNASVMLLREPRGRYCSEATCDFTDGPCEYVNDIDSAWKLKTLGSGNVVAYVQDDISMSRNQYLISNRFVLTETALLEFTYFESSIVQSHIRVCTRSPDNTIWVPPQPEFGWRAGQVLLPAGPNQLIFAAEALIDGAVVALDNIRIATAEASLDVCL